ncbi:hypothetical protein, partial [Mesorhizobium sp.]|uniref:hypothetical protein n=1 Tax=Mesorhizobium sp. TaxID=1871066 RepID=UPI0025F57E7C
DVGGSIEFGFVRRIVVQSEILFERRGRLVVPKLVAHRQIVFEWRHVFERTGERIVEIVFESSFNSRRGCAGNARAYIVGSNGIGGFVCRIVVQQ